MGLLVLSRKQGEFIRIITPSGEIVWVGVREIDRGKIRLVFEADRSVEIHREENLPSNLQRGSS